MKMIKSVIAYIALALCILVFVMNLIYISNVSDGWQEQVTISYFGIINLIVSALIAIGIIGVSYCTNKILRKRGIVLAKKHKIALLAVALILYIIIEGIWIYVRDATPIADSMRVYRSASQIFNGEALTEAFYFEFNPHNLTLSYMFAGIFTIIHSCNLIILKGLNVIANCFTIVGLYFILNQLKKDYKVNKVLFFLLAFTYIPIILLVNFIYGDLISLPFVIFSIYFAIKYVNHKKKRYIIISSILMAIGIILRMNNLIFMIAVTMYLFLDIFGIKKKEFRNKEKVKQLFLKLAFVILFILLSILPSNILKSCLANAYHLDLNKEFPSTRYIAMGMQEGMRANGWYNETGDMGWKEEVSNEQYIEMIKQRLGEFSQDIGYTIKFYAKKIASMWAEPLQESIWQNLSFNFETYQPEEEYTEEEVQELQKVDNALIGKRDTLQLYQKAWMGIVFGMAIVFIIKNRKNISNEALLLFICFIGGFMFHILWEGKSRYIIPYIIILIPLAGITLEFGKKQEKKKALLGQPNTKNMDESLK